MRIIRILFPVLILLVLSIISYQQYHQLPPALLATISFLPFVLVVLVVGLAIHFNNSSVFFYTLLLVLNYIVLTGEWKQADLSTVMLASSLPLFILIFALLPGRGLFSLKVLPVYVFLLSAAGLSSWIYQQPPQWLIFYLMSDWLPARYFDWVNLPQTVLAHSVVISLFMLVLFISKPSTHFAVAFGILILLFMQYFLQDSRSVILFGSASLLMCLYAVVQESWRMAYLDELTELPGRRALREKFQSISGLYTVAMLDVDHFKKFNDKYGHDTGDAVLRMIAAKMSKVSGGGLAYRYGGEEFTVVFNGENNQSAKTHLEVLRMSIADNPFVINRQDRRQHDSKTNGANNIAVKVTVSIGVADSKESVKSPWDVFKLADKALYKAKKKGRNQTCVS